MVSATSAEISVIRRPQVTRRSQDVLIEEEEEEVQDDEDGGGDQSSFQSCTSPPPLAQVPQNELDMDSRLTLGMTGMMKMYAKSYSKTYKNI